MRILPQVHELRLRGMATQAQVPSEASAWRRNLSRQIRFSVRSRWSKESRLLPESLPSRKAFSRLKNSVLRRRTLSLLRNDRVRRAWLPLRRLLLQRKAPQQPKQCVLHPHPPHPSTQRLRQPPHQLLLPPHPRGRQDRLPRETPLRHGPCLLPQLLAPRPLLRTPRPDRSPQHHRPLRPHRHDSRRSRRRTRRPARSRPRSRHQNIRPPSRP